MVRYIAAYIGAAVAFVALDAGWLTLVAPKIYKPIENILLTGTVRPAPAILFYLMFVAGIVFFAVRPALASGHASEALVNGAVFGLIAYGTYALTNHAVMRGWQPVMTISDMGWGAVASAAGAVAGFYAARVVPS
jgi:uncharacterized membrane protein